MPILLRTPQVNYKWLILFGKSRNVPDEAYGRKVRSSGDSQCWFYCPKYDLAVVRISSNAYPRNTKLLVSLYKHGTVFIIVHYIDLLVKQKKLFEDISIYCYNIDDNVLMTTDKQQTLIFWRNKSDKKIIYTCMQIHLTGCMQNEYIFAASKPFFSGIFVNWWIRDDISYIWNDL